MDELENPLDTLPLELLLEILSYFKDVRDLKLLCLVCKKWKYCLESKLGVLDKFTLSYESMDLKNAINHRSLKSVTRNYTRIHIFKNSRECVTNTKKILTYFKIKHLSLEYFNSTDVSSVLKSAPSSLVCLELKDISYTSDKEKELEPNSVQNLNISFRTVHRDCKFFKSFQNLSILKIFIKHNEEMKILKHLAAANSKTLRVLEIDFGDDFGLYEDFSFLKDLDNLKTFNFYNMNNRHCDVRRVLENLVNIESMELDEVHIPIQMLDTIRRNFKNLRTLKLNSLKNDFLAVLRIPLKCLTKLSCDFENMSLNWNPSDIQFNPFLTTLTLNSKLFSKDVITDMVKKFPNVRDFCTANEREDIDEIDAEPLRVISLGWRLKKLTLMSNSLFWDLTISIGQKIEFPEITHLQLQYCKNVDKLFKHLKFPSISNLIVSDCYRNTLDEEKLANTCHYYRLEELYWSPNKAPKFSRLFPNLKDFLLNMKLKSGLNFLKKLRNRCFTGAIDLEDGEFYENKKIMYEAWQSYVEEIANFHNLRIEVADDDRFKLRNSFIQLQIQFINWGEDDFEFLE